MVEENTDQNKFNLILIDNGSSDGTSEFLLTKNRHRILLNTENLGVIKGRNQGFKLFESDSNDFICFLDNDQFVEKKWLEQYYDYMISFNIDVAGAEAWLMNDRFLPVYQCRKNSEPYSYVSCCGMFIKRSVVAECGFFDEMFSPAYFEDPDFCFRAKEKGFRVGWNADAKIIHMPHQTLGKNPHKVAIFQNSYNNFKMKWNGKKILPIRNMENSR